MVRVYPFVQQNGLRPTWSQVHCWDLLCSGRVATCCRICFRQMQCYLKFGLNTDSVDCKYQLQLPALHFNLQVLSLSFVSPKSPSLTWPVTTCNTACFCQPKMGYAPFFHWQGRHPLSRAWPVTGSHQEGTPS